MSSPGLGTTIEINDGSANAFVAVADVVSITPPGDELQSAVSKRLNLTDGLLGKVPTTTDGGEFSFTYEYDADEFDRINALKGESKSFKITPNGGTAYTIPGYVTKNMQNEIIADEIQTCTANVMVNGPITYA